jgi:peptidoglycan hydrolase-like protein with peptidoglycan-binding domain
MQSSFHGGTSIQSQVANLLAIGNTARAAQLEAQWPSLFASTTPARASQTSSSVFTFTRDLQLGDTGADVQELQRYLNARGYLVAVSGPGSTGSETNLFGPATERALISFQLAKQIAPAAGYFGPKTRAALGAPAGQPAVSAAAASPLPAAASATYARDLDVGSTGDDVRELQAYLNEHGFPVASSGPGSLGSETRVFGWATQLALKSYQQAVGILPAAGYFGSKTRAYIQAHP